MNREWRMSLKDERLGGPTALGRRRSIMRVLPLEDGRRRYLQPLIADRELGLNEAQQGQLSSVAGLGAVLSSALVVRLVSGGARCACVGPFLDDGRRESLERVEEEIT